MSKHLLWLVCLWLAAHAEVIPFDNSAREKIFRENQPALLLLISDISEASESTAAREALGLLDGHVGSLLLIVVDEKGKDDHGLFYRMAQYLRVDPKTSPIFLYMDEKKDRYMFNDRPSKDALADFVASVKAG
jgi:hypothetical protein